MVKRKVKKKQNLDERILVNFFDSKKYRAIIYDDNGSQIATIPLNRSRKTFNYQNMKYVIKWDNKTYFSRSNVFNSFKYFHYHKDNPEPIEFDGKHFVTPELNTEIFNELMDTKVTKDLNNVHNSLASLLTPKVILIGLGVIAVGYYFLSGGTIT